MTSEIINGNKTIALFDGYKFYPDDRLNGVKGVFKKDGKLSMVAEDLDYHSSWNDLMPVVEKINKIFSEKSAELSNHSADQEHLTNQLDNPLHWKSWSYHYIGLSTDINIVYRKTIDALKWYNTQSK